jgi:phosphatidate cytidylyltransferase
LLRTRVLTGLALALVVLASIFGLETTWAGLVFAFFWLIGTDEWARLTGLTSGRRLLYDAVFGSIIVAGLILELPVAAGLTVLWLAAIVWILAFVVVLRYPVRLSRPAIRIMGLVVLPAAWLSFLMLHGVPSNGPGLVLAGLCIVWTADIGAYFIGRNFGRKALAPSVSPKKTWEGVAGGVVFATATGVVAALMLDLPPLLLGPIAAAMALISVVGDLSVSMLKRNAGLKDCGVLLPGHGGVMDRFDGVTAALPFFVLGLQFAHVLD